MTRLAAGLTAVGLLCGPLSGLAQAPVDPRTLQAEVSLAEIEQTLHALDLDRTAGSEGERAAAAYLSRKLSDYGISHTTHESRVFLSWPGRAELAVPDQPAMRGKTAVFAAPTPTGGLRGVVLLDPPVARRADQTLAFGPEVKGRIPVLRGIADTEALVLAGQTAGALAIVVVDRTDTLHEDTVTSIWGTPSVESAARLPRIPYLCITRSDGERLAAAAASGPLTVTLLTEVRRAWRVVPNVVAEVPGRSADFVLVTTHFDAWYRGMTDTAGTVATILDMARVLQKHEGELERGVRFAWWSGHSFGRYAGSGWYVDRFWADLDRHGVAYTNLDGAGRRGSRMDAVTAGGWPGLAEYARESVPRLTGKPAPAPRGGGRVFRPGRDSDSAYQGIGIPFFSIGVPGPGEGHPDVDVTGRIVYWHTPDDTIDKFDMKALELDTQYRVAQIYDLATMRVLPHRLAPIAASYGAALADLAASTGTAFDLAPALEAAARLQESAARFDSAPRPTDGLGVDAFNRFVVQVTHRLNSTLYSANGRFDQDPASELAALPLLARARELPTLPAGSDEAGFLETQLLRGRNHVEATLRETTEAIDAYLTGRR